MSFLLTKFFFFLHFACLFSSVASTFSLTFPLEKKRNNMGIYRDRKKGVSSVAHLSFFLNTLRGGREGGGGEGGGHLKHSLFFSL